MMQGAIRHKNSGKDVFKGILTCLIAACAFCPVQAQRLVKADVLSQQLSKGQKTKQDKHLYCQQNGRMLVDITENGKRNILLTDQYGRTEIYDPETNKVLYDAKAQVYASIDEPLQLFLQRRTQDMGLEDYGFKLENSTVEDGKFIKKTFKSSDAASHCAKVEIVYENYLPIFMAFYSHKGKPINKIYYSQYDLGKSFIFPARVTEISYLGAKDSVIRLDIYSNIQVDTYDAMFDFKVPADAERSEMP